MKMEEHMVRPKHILAALCISLVLCAGITLVFWGAEKKSAAKSSLNTGQTERTENIVS